MAYANYEYYTGTYKGSTIPSADFDRLATRASSFLDRVVSSNELTNIVNTDKVKMATCAIAEAWLINEQGGDITNQTVGSWSKSFNKATKTDEGRLMEAAKLYLGNIVKQVRWV